MTTMWNSPERRGEHCASCAAERVFEQPPCPDGHGAGECPEWACSECGHALLLGSGSGLPGTPGVPVGAARAPHRPMASV